MNSEHSGDEAGSSGICTARLPQPLVAAAMSYAIHAHGEQRYGELPYRSHLAAVHRVIVDHGFHGSWEAAAWLHDVLEDTPAGRDEIRDLFGEEVLALVEACTGEGRNRKQRNQSIYDKIDFYRPAAVLKTADRIANVEASPADGSHREMYRKEANAFHANVARHAPKHMQDRLDRAYSAPSRALVA